MSTRMCFHVDKVATKTPKVLSDARVVQPPLHKVSLAFWAIRSGVNGASIASGSLQEFRLSCRKAGKHALQGCHLLANQWITQRASEDGGDSPVSEVRSGGEDTRRAE